MRKSRSTAAPTAVAPVTLVELLFSNSFMAALGHVWQLAASSRYPAATLTAAAAGEAVMGQQQQGLAAAACVLAGEQQQQLLMARRRQTTLATRHQTHLTLPTKATTTSSNYS